MKLKRMNDVFWGDYEEQLARDHISPAEEMADVIEVMQYVGEEGFVARLKAIHEKMLAGEKQIKWPGRRRAEPIEDALNLIICDIAEAGWLVDRDRLTLAMKNAYFWSYLELETIDHRTRSGIPYTA